MVPSLSVLMGFYCTLYFTLYRYGDYAEVLNISRFHCTKWPHELSPFSGTLLVLDCTIQVHLITCTARNISRTSNCGIRVINWFHCQPFYEKKKKKKESRPSPLLFAQLLATERGRQLTKARANKATGLNNGRAATCTQEVTCSPFCALFRRQLTFPFCC